jgi:hypothetical protein
VKGAVFSGSGSFGEGGGFAYSLSVFWDYTYWVLITPILSEQEFGGKLKN